MKSISIVLFLSLFQTVVVSKLNAQELFEVDAKVGLAYYVFTEPEFNTGLAADLNLGFLKDRNSFGLTFSYYNQPFLLNETERYNNSYTVGIYYARQLMTRSKADLRLGLTLGIGAGNYWTTYKYGIHSESYGAALASKIFVSGHYYFTKNIALSYEIGLRTILSSINREIIMAPIIGIAYIF